MTDCVIIGGGVIGLSIARELAGRGASVHVLTRERGRDTASWAAAGIFPPAPPPGDGASAGERLTAWSDTLHRRWAEELRAETGIDTELRRCGGLHVAASDAGLDRLAAAAAAWHGRGAECHWLTPAEIAAQEPALAPGVAAGIRAGFLLPDEMRLRPPRHLAALEASCRQRGVVITSGHARTIDRRAGQVDGIVTDGGVVRGAAYCFAAGAWSGTVVAALGLAIETRPIRGQILLLRMPRQVLGSVVNFGIDYLVPREDGRLLVGSTIEDAGFAPLTTPEAVDRMCGVAKRLLGDVPGATVEQAWAGLRPGSTDGLPTLGRIPDVDNAFIATGHFRAGLHQSTGTAVVLADLVTGAPPTIDLTPFAPNRRSVPSATPAPDSVAAYLARAAMEQA